MTKWTKRRSTNETILINCVLDLAKGIETQHIVIE